MIKGIPCIKFLLTALLASLSTSASVTFPYSNRLASESLTRQSEVVISQSEDNPETVEGEVVTNDVRQFL